MSIYHFSLILQIICFKILGPKGQKEKYRGKSSKEKVKVHKIIPSMNKPSGDIASRY